MLPISFTDELFLVVLQIGTNVLSRMEDVCTGASTQLVVTSVLAMLAMN